MRIAQVLGESPWGDVTPAGLQAGMGGRETALVRLSEEWAKLGHEVINFVPTKEPVTTHHDGGSATYAPVETGRGYLETFETDAVVSWESHEVFFNERVRMRTHLCVLEMQVAHVNPFQDPKRMADTTDVWTVLSSWAGRFLETQVPIGRDDWRVMPNGVDLSGYPTRPPSKRTGTVFHYSSSPDRGLHHLLRIWPRIRAMRRGAELHVAYGVEGFMNALLGHNMQAEVALRVRNGLRGEGVVYRGKMGQGDLALLQRASTAWIYPCDTMQPTETGCITAVEAGAAGAPMITTDCDCLGEEYGHCAEILGLPFEDNEWVETIERILGDPTTYRDMQERGRTMAEGRSWGRLAPRWLEMFEELRR